MSINIGYLSKNYEVQNIGSMDNRLVINTYNNSNAININTNTNSTSNAVINYKNKFKTGVINNNFVIQNSSNDNAMVLTNSNIDFNKNIKFNNDITLKTLLSSSNNTISINSNINISLYRENNFNINIPANNNTQTLGYSFNKDDFTSYKNVVLKQQLLVDEIYPTGKTTGNVSIYRANLIDFTIYSTNITNKISINNLKTQPYIETAFIINRFYNSYNLLEFNTLNFNENTTSNTYYNEPLYKHFIIDDKGMVGIGSKQPDAPLSITANYNNNPYVFKYSGKYLSDTFNITKNANVGIGTTEPSGILHINRNDDVYDNITSNLLKKNARSTPLLKLNIDYDIEKNIINNSNTDFTINSNTINIKNLFNYNSLPPTQFDSRNTSQLNNNIYILNDSLLSLVNNDINNFANIGNSTSSNISFKSFTLTNYLKDNTFSAFNTDTLKLQFINNICYPENIFVSDLTSIYRHTETYSTIPNPEYDNSYTTTKIHNYTHGVIIMSKNTYDLGGYNSDVRSFKYNANKFITITSNYLFSTPLSERKMNTSNFNEDINLKLIFYLENSNLTSYYNTSNFNIISPVPDFLYITSNNNYKASLSYHGTLSLGEKYNSNDNKYLLYVPNKSVYINNAEINTISTSNEFVSFDNKNISYINTITATSNNIINGNYNLLESSNINTSNIIISNGLYIDNVTMNSENVHFTNKLSISNDKTSDTILSDLSTLMKLTVNSNITNVNEYFKNRDGIVVTNKNHIDNINPSIGIIGNNGSFPLLKLSKNPIIEIDKFIYNNNTYIDYFIRLSTKLYVKDTRTYLEQFEICNNNIIGKKINYYNNLNSSRTDTNIVPSFIKHIKNYNLLCFGEINNICIKCENTFSDNFETFGQNPILDEMINNSTNKISIGIPINESSIFNYKTQEFLEDWPQLFNNYICNSTTNSDIYNKYGNNMLNIFGNSGIWSVSGNNMIQINMKTVYNQNTARDIDTGCDVVIGTDNILYNKNTNLNVYGKITSVFPNLTCADNTNIINSLRIVNPINNIKLLSGYRYQRSDNDNEFEIGLNASEVQTQYPDLVKTHNSKPYIQYGNMSALLIEAIKELSNKIDTLTTSIDSIEERLTSLENP